MSAPHADRDHSEQPCCGDHNHEPCRGCPDGRDEIERAVADAVVAAGDADEVTRLRAESAEAALREATRRIVGYDEAFAEEMRRAEAAESERDRLAEVVARVEALADEQWLDPVNYKAPVSPVLKAIQNRLRAALSGPSPAQTPATATEPAPRAADDAEGQSGTGEALGGAAESGEEGKPWYFDSLPKDDAEAEKRAAERRRKAAEGGAQ